VAVESQLLNRFARSQAQGPTTDAGGRTRGAVVASVMDQRSTSAIRALYQFMNRLIDRLMVR